MRDDKRGVPGQRESAGPGQMSREWPSVCGEYSTRSGRKTSNLTLLLPDSPLQKEKNADQGLRLGIVRVYPKSVTAKSVNRFSDRQRQRRTSAHNQDAGAFFAPYHLSYGGGAWETFGSAGSFVPGSLTRVSAASPCLATVMAVPKSDEGTDTMPNPLVTLHQSRAHSQRAMAMAALRSDSSLSVRRRRYNSHMDKARAAEARIRQYAAIPSTQHTHPETRATALSLIEPRLNEWRDNPEPAEGRELVGLICMASALGALSLEDQARIVTHFKPNTQGANNHA